MKSNARRLILCFLLLALIWVVPVVVGVGIVVANVAGVVWTQEDMLQAIRDRGEPATFDDLDALYPPVPDEDNAALVYQRAFDAFQMPATLQEEDLLPLVGRAELPLPDESLSDEMLTAAEQHLSANESALQLAHAAAQYESCRFTIDYSVEYTSDLPHLEGMSSISSLLELEAIVHAERDRSKAARIAIVDSLAIPRFLEAEPLYGSYLSRLSKLNNSLTGLRHVLSKTSLDEEDLGAIADALAGFDHQQALHRGLVGERCEILANFDDYVILPMFSGLSKRRYASFMERLIKANELPFHEAIVKAEKVVAELEEESFIYFAATMALLSVDRVFNSAANVAAHHACTQVLVAIERYKLDHDALPRSLDELVPDYLNAVPADPFDGAPLRYKRLEQGQAVYSIWVDREDDGGAFELVKHGRFAKDGDMVFLVEAPPPTEAAGRV